MADEMRAHLDALVERHVAAGLSPVEARYAAQRQFGHLEGIKEQCRDQRGFAWLRDFVQDLDYGVRQLRKAPVFTVVAVLTLALGIGATTAIFSMVNSVVLRPLPFADPGSLVALRETSGASKSPGMVTRAAYLLWTDKSTSFSSIAAYRYGTGMLGESGTIEQVPTYHVTTNYFRTLGVEPMLGRGFVAGETIAGNGNIAVVSHQFWLRKLLGRPDALNRTLRLNDEIVTIVGVLPPNTQLDATDLFLPETIAPSDRDSFRPRDVFEVVARLNPGVTLEQASAEIGIFAGVLSTRFPVSHKGIGAVVLPLLDDVLARSTYMMSGIRPLLYTILGAVAFLLVIACVNVASLVFARATTRRREIALRAALGASRGRIVRQLLCESLLLATLGGILGTFFAFLSLNLLKTLGANLPRASEISIDGGTLAFSCAISLFTAIGFGLLPALRATRFSLHDAIKEGTKTIEGHPSKQLHGMLVVAEVALTLVLLTGAGLLIHSFIRLQKVDLGFQPEGVFANRLQIPAKKFDSPEKVALFANQVLERVSRLPQVNSVAFTTGMPIFGSYGVGFTVAGRPVIAPGQSPGGVYAAVSPSYFKTIGIALVSGREFTDRDNSGAPRVAIISEAIAKRYFADQNPLHQFISLSNGKEAWREIVGVVRDTKQWGPVGADGGSIYEPFAQRPDIVGLLLVVKTTTEAKELPVALRTTIQSLEPDVPLNTMYRLTDGVAASITKYRISTIIFALFSSVAVLLAAIGIYGVVAHNVTQRTQEIGVRIALGAQSADIMRLIFMHAGRFIGFGLLLGLAGSLATARLLGSLLYNTSPYDPLSYVAIVLFLSFIAFLACWIPTRRATEVDPIVALRYD